MDRSMSLLIHGDTKVGKSTLAVTAPYPRCLLDVEGGANRFLPINKRHWDPNREEPPIADGSWDTCVVVVRDYDTVVKTYQWFQTGQHQFKSLVIDSLSELQVRLQEQLIGRGLIDQRGWGEILRNMAGLMRDLRDLTIHPTNPLEAVVLTAMSKESNGLMVPYLQGQSAVVAPYLFDVIGALVVEEYPNPDPTQPPYRMRRLFVDKHPRYMAGERVQGRLGRVVEQADLSIDRMLDIIYGPRQETVATAAAAT